jgi:hypothetical protein
MKPNLKLQVGQVTEKKQTSAVSGDVLIVAGLEAEEGADFVMALAERLR